MTQLTGVGVPLEGLIFSDAVSYAAGDVVIGAQAATTATISVANISEVETGVISTVLVGAGAASFVIVSEDCTTLVPNATCSVTVRFDPQAPAGAKVAQLSVSANPGNTILSADFTGNAIAP